MRRAGVALILLMIVGSLALWIAIPAGWLWLASQLSNRYELIYILALFGCPITMILWGIGLARIHAAYLRLSGADPARGGRSAWLRSSSGERPGEGEPRPVLDVIMAGSVLLAIVVFTVWFFFFASSFNPTYAPPR